MAEFPETVADLERDRWPISPKPAVGSRAVRCEEVESALNKVKLLLDKMRKELPKRLLKGELTEEQLKG